jgi:SPP1 gp7 family putative phage head morphogenesis protein
LRITEQYAGAKKSGKPLVLYGGAKYENMGLTPTELSFLESKRMTRDDITMIYGVPKELLGLGAEGGFQSTAFDGAVRAFLAHTVKPLVGNLVEKLNVFLAPADVELGFVDPTPEDVELKLKQVASGTADSYMTINEKRELMGLEAIEGGDVILVPMSVIPLGDAVAAPEPETPRTEPAEAAPQAKPDAEPQPEPPATKGHHPLMVKANRQKYGRERVRRLRARQEEGLKAARRIFTAQKNRVLGRLEDKVPTTKMSTGLFVKTIADDVFDKASEVELARKALLPFLEKWAKQSGTEAMVFSGKKPPFSLTQRLSATLNMRADLFAGHSVDTAHKKVERAIAKAVEDGTGREGMVENIRRVYGEMSRGHANTIARTEVGVASQSGTMEGYKQSGVRIKIWVAVQDADTRDAHSDMDGEEAPIDMPFSNGLMTPLDPDGPAEEVVNCRCSI